jgi:hypothetical protein
METRLRELNEKRAELSVRNEGVNESRTDELVKNVGENLLPRLTKMPGFSGYYLIEAGNGVMSSIGFFETSAQSDESTRVAATWVRDEKLERALPNPPKITGGEVVVHETNGLVRAYSRALLRGRPAARAFPVHADDSGGAPVSLGRRGGQRPPLFVGRPEGGGS